MQLYAIRSKIITTRRTDGLGRLDDIGTDRGGPLHQKPLVALLLGGRQRATGARPQGTDLRVDDSGGPDSA